MRKVLKNEKGFTLIELLAVIVILGVLMIVAIPMVTKYIEQARRDSFVSTVKAYIDGARYMYLNDELSGTSGCSIGKSATIPISSIQVDNAGKSPFGGDLKGYVTITAAEETDFAGNPTYTYTYYATIQDSSKKWGVFNVQEQNLKRKEVKQDSSKTIADGSLTCS